MDTVAVERLETVYKTRAVIKITRYFVWLGSSVRCQAAKPNYVGLVIVSARKTPVKIACVNLTKRSRCAIIFVCG